MSIYMVRDEKVLIPENGKCAYPVRDCGSVQRGGVPSIYGGILNVQTVRYTILQLKCILCGPELVNMPPEPQINTSDS